MSLYDEIDDDDLDSEIVPLGNGEYGVISTLRCIECGCTAAHACSTQTGNCFWVSDDPPICSGCAYETTVVSGSEKPFGSAAFD